MTVANSSAVQCPATLRVQSKLIPKSKLTSQGEDVLVALGTFRGAVIGRDHLPPVATADCSIADEVPDQNRFLWRVRSTVGRFVSVGWVLGRRSARYSVLFALVFEM